MIEPVVTTTAAPVIGVPSRYFCVDNLAPIGSGTLESAYTETGERPGRVIPDQATRWALEIAGGQSQTVRIGALQGGVRPGVCYRPEPSTDDKAYRGNLGPSWPHDVREVLAPPGVGAWRPHACLIRERQKLAVVAGNGTLQARVTVRDPQTGAWSSSVAVGTAGACPVIWYDEEQERLVVWPRADKSILASDDDGATFTAVQPPPLNPATWPAAATEAAAAWSPSGIIALWSTGTELYHASSFDGGSTWQLVGTTDTPDDFAQLGGVIALRAGGFLVWWSIATGPAIRTQYIPTADTPLADSIGKSPGIARQALVCGIYEQPGGRLWLHVSGSSSTVVSTYYSDTIGRQWTQADGWDRPAYSAGDIAGYKAYYVGQERVHVWATSSTTGRNGALFGTVTGGWSNVEADPADTTSGTGVPGIQGTFQGQTAGRRWYRSTLPLAQNWTVTAGGTESMGINGLVLTSAAATQYYSYADGTGATVVHHGTLVVVSGTTRAMEVVKRDGAGSEYIAQVLVTTTAVLAVDGVSAGTIGTVPIDTTAGVEVWGVVRAGGTWSVWVRARGGTAWTLLADATLTAQAVVVAADTFRWGHVSTSTAETRWSLAYSTSGAELLSGFASGGTNYSRMRWGAQLRGGLPMPEIADADERVAFLRQYAGPARYGDTMLATCEPEHGIARLDPLTWPDGDSYWEAEGTSGVELVFDAGAQVRERLRRIGLVMTGVNFTSASLEAYLGGFWINVGTADTTLTSGNVTITGLQCVPTSGTAGPLAKDELKGGYVVIAGVAYRIASNTPGTFQNNQILPVLTLESAPASGTYAAVIRHKQVLLWANTNVAVRYYRVVISAGQAVPAGEGYRASCIAILDAYPMPEADWGEQEASIPQIEVTALPTGNRIQRRTGRARRRLTVGWQSGVDLGARQRGDRQSADGVTFEALAEDAGHTLANIGAAAVGAPIVLCRTGEITSYASPALWVWGWWDGQWSASYQYEDPGDQESARIDTVTVEEA